MSGKISIERPIVGKPKGKEMNREPLHSEAFIGLSASANLSLEPERKRWASSGMDGWDGRWLMAVSCVASSLHARTPTIRSPLARGGGTRSGSAIATTLEFRRSAVGGGTGAPSHDETVVVLARVHALVLERLDELVEPRRQQRTQDRPDEVDPVVRGKRAGDDSRTERARWVHAATGVVYAPAKPRRLAFCYLF